MNDATLVRIERTELLIEARLFHLLGKQPRDLPQLDVLAFAVLERIDEDPPLVAPPADAAADGRAPGRSDNSSGTADRSPTGCSPASTTRRPPEPTGT